MSIDKIHLWVYNVGKLWKKHEIEIWRYKNVSRAEMRRLQREEEKKKKTFVMTGKELQKIREQEYARAKQELQEVNDNLAEELLLMMLVIPTNVLINDYWEKSAKKRIPKFVKDCMSLFRSWEDGHVSMTEMQKLTEEYAGFSLIQKGTATDQTIQERKKKGID